MQQRNAGEGKVSWEGWPGPERHKRISCRGLQGGSQVTYGGARQWEQTCGAVRSFVRRLLPGSDGSG